MATKTAATSIRRIIQTSKAPSAIGPYNQAVVVDKTVYLSGQIAMDPATGAIIPGGVAAETHQVLKNMQAVLQEVGVGLGNVVKTTVYLKDINDFSTVNEVYAQYFTTKYPARAAFQVAALPKNALVEIEGVAVTGEIDDQ